jgi:hypothetical protein
MKPKLFKTLRLQDGHVESDEGDTVFMVRKQASQPQKGLPKDRGGLQFTARQVGENLITSRVKQTQWQVLKKLEWKMFNYPNWVSPES